MPKDVLVGVALGLGKFQSLALEAWSAYHTTSDIEAAFIPSVCLIELHGLEVQRPNIFRNSYCLCKSILSECLSLSKLFQMSECTDR